VSAKEKMRREKLKTGKRENLENFAAKVNREMV
jgi:hypothetical protein